MLSEITDLIDAHTIISFDVFDTALLRVSGDHYGMFKLIQATLQSNEDLCFRYPNVVINFIWMRREAEAAARRERVKEEGDSEVTFDEIYDVFAEVAGVPLSIAQRIQEIEVRVETNQLHVNLDVYEMWHYAVSAGKQVAFISDMYHSSNQIATWLMEAGYRDPDVYVSCEYRVSKRLSGALFEAIGFSLPVCHIGDNPVSDVQNVPATWSSYLYEYVYQHPQYVTGTRPEYGLLRGPLRVAGRHDSWGAIGASIFGPLVLGFLLWIDSVAPVDTPLLTFSRDGFLIQQLIAHMFPHRQSYYVDASRIATLVPSLYSFDLQKLERYLGGRGGRTVRALLELYGLHNPDQYTDIVTAAGFQSMTSLVTKETMKQFSAILIRLQPELQCSAKDALAAIHSYLKTIEERNDAITIVDLGWTGSMQGHLSQILNLMCHSVHITGLYYQLWNLDDFKRNSIHDTYSAYLRDVGAPHSLTYALQHGGVEILETVLSEPVGTVLRYEGDRAIHEDYSHPQAAAIYEMQEGIRQYVETMASVLSDIDSSTLTMYAWNEPFARLVLFPTDMEAEMIGSLEHSDGVGHIAGRECPLAPIAPTNQFEAQIDRAYWTQGYILRNQLRHT